MLLIFSQTADMNKPNLLPPKNTVKFMQTSDIQAESLMMKAPFLMFTIPEKACVFS